MEQYLFSEKYDAAITRLATMIAIFTIGALMGIGVTLIIEHLCFC
ncbi:MAG: hypothetical protein AB1567_06875 [bacterium]